MNKPPTSPTTPKKLSDFKLPLSPEDRQELTKLLQKLHRSIATLRKEYDNFAVIASDAYDPYTRKLKFTTKPTFPPLCGKSPKSLKNDGASSLIRTILKPKNKSELSWSPTFLKTKTSSFLPSLNDLTPSNTK